MARIKAISATMVKNLAGVIDFYYWRGIPICRRWPKLTKKPPTEGVLASRAAFVQSRADLRLVSAGVREVWAQSAVGVTEAWLDYYTSIFMRTWRDYRRYPPVVTKISVTED